ncbi:hypothetical protein C5167_022846 [Papaver somniferum]|uniref:Uncharacterized protein n=1 Tax=Papaver somniferum TaxID=3469 RepID=A0A4Y7JM16_PAPSO|nr:hypothetical protein C5167_022846 [Papaver somniferum]
MDSLLKNKDLADGQIMALTKSLEALQKDLKDRELQVQDLKQSLELQRQELNDCRDPHQQIALLTALLAKVNKVFGLKSKSSTLVIF